MSGPRQPSSPASPAPAASAAPGRICPTCQTRYDDATAFCPRDGTPLVLEAPGQAQSRVGQVLAERYRVVRKIGEGGMGEVYEADHIYIDKKFAIKLLRREATGDPEQVARFHQEARSASKIGHDNIVEIDDFGRLPDGSVYLAMEYLAGRSLADHMAAAPLDFGSCFEVAVQVCDGLDAAHDKGIVHRDMKPENIFLAEKNGRTLVKILDFGIAKVSGADGGSQRLTRTGTVFGTPHYMSPEQALGKPADQRSDIYAVGVILYEMFVGRVPFQAETFMGILTQHLTQAPVPPREAAPERGIPEAVEALILRAMAKDASLRYGSLGELAESLEQARAMWRASSPEVRASALRPVFELDDEPGTGVRRRARAVSQAGALAGVTGATGEAPRRTGQPTPGTGQRVPSMPSGEVADPAAMASTAGDPAAAVDGAADGLALPAGRSWKRMVAIAAGAAVVAGALVVLLVWRLTRTAGPVTPAIVDVIVDTVPAGAAIYDEAGKIVGQTPQHLAVAGAGATVRLRLDGFEERAVRLDGKDAHPVIRLERRRAATTRPATPATPTPLAPTPPPRIVALPTPGPGTPSRPAPKPTKPPKKKPGTKTTPLLPPGPSEVLDPYR